MNVRPRLARFAAVLAVVSLVALAPSPAQADGYVPISGSGSTWSQNALDQWRKNVASNYGMTVNYSGTGSSAGRTDFRNSTVDFAISEIPFQDNPRTVPRRRRRSATGPRCRGSSRTCRSWRVAPR